MFLEFCKYVEYSGLVDSGVDAKYLIQEGLVLVNGNIETQRGKKLVAGDVVEFDGDIINIEA